MERERESMHEREGDIVGFVKRRGRPSCKAFKGAKLNYLPRTHI